MYDILYNMKLPTHLRNREQGLNRYGFMVSWTKPEHEPEPGQVGSRSPLDAVLKTAGNFWPSTSSVVFS